MTEPELNTHAFHAGKRRWLLVVGGNLLLLVVMLGMPWARGYLRTEALLGAFSRYAACLYGGAPAREPGLGMPRDHEAHFATRALEQPGFVAACDDALSALAPAPATFILPSLKVAEADLRAAVGLVREELAQLATRAPRAPLSVRPLAALERLRAGLANHARAAGRLEAPQADAFELPSGAAVLPVPARVPLSAGAGAQVSLWGSDAELHALATDRTGISYVHVAAGKLEQVRVARPKLLEAAVPREAPSALVWATQRARCDARAGGCADKALGIARVVPPLAALPEPRWLGAHPHGRIDRSLVRTSGGVAVAAALADGAAELREFALASEAESSADASMPPLAAARVWPRRIEGTVLVLPVAGAARVLVARQREHEVALFEVTPEGERPLAKLPGDGMPWLVACVEGGRIGFAFGHAEALVLGALAQSGEHAAFAPLALRLAAVVDEHDPGRDRVAPLCGLGGGATALAHDAEQRLWLLHCDPGASACARTELASKVGSFAALAAGERVIAAYAGESSPTPVLVQSLSPTAPTVAERVPAVCWSDARGLCGPPLLARLGQRVVLGAREGTDLRVLESGDEGRSWAPLAGLGRYH